MEQDVFEDGYSDCKNCVGYLNVHPVGSKLWQAYIDGYRQGYCS